MSELPARKEDTSGFIKVKYADILAAPTIGSIFSDARGLGKEKRRWFRRVPPPPLLMDKDKLIEKFREEEARSEGEPRSLIAYDSNQRSEPKAVGYILLGKPSQREGEAYPRVEIDDVAVRQEDHRNVMILKQMIEHMTHFRFEGKPLIFDTWATENTFSMLSKPGIARRLAELGYETVDTNEKSINGNESFHKVSLVPKN